MNYTDPLEVKSPKISISNLEPIVDRGEEDYSVALLNWEKKPRVAMRWNGGKREDSKISPGNPQSRGLPTWFVLPEEFDIAILNTIKEKGLLGGGNIATGAAGVAIDLFLSKKGPAETGMQQRSHSLEETIIQIIFKLKAQGKI